MALNGNTNGLTLTGSKELEKVLNKLPKAVAKKIVRKAVRAGQKIQTKEAKVNARSMVGGDLGRRMASAIATRAAYKQRKGQYSLQSLIDPKKAAQFKGVSKTGKSYYLPAAVEFGHIKTGGGFVKGIPFMTTAHHDTKDRRQKEVFKILKQGIEAVK